MAYLNVKERVLEAKVVYYGAGLSGKTTNLEQIKKLSDADRCGEMMSLDTDGDRTLFFDWLPFNMGKFNGCDIRVQLYTVPGQAKYAETRKRVLASADGVVLVLDSQSGAMDKNRQTVSDLREHMQANGMSLGKIPVVVQLNKRDLPTAMDGAEMLAALGIADWPCVPAVAARGEGVFETLQEVTRLVLQSVRNSARANASELKTGAASGLDGHSTYNGLVDGGIAPAKPAASPAPAMARPAAVRPAAPAVPMAAAPAAAPPAAKPASNGHNGNGHHAGNGAAAGLAMGVAAPAAAIAPPPAARSVIPVEDRSVTTSVSTDTTLMARTLTQLGELLTGQQALLRRTDAMEKHLESWSGITKAPSLGEGKMDERLSSIENHLQELRAQVAASTERLERLIEQRSDALIDEVREAATTGEQNAQGRFDKTIRGLEEWRSKSKAELQQSVSYLERRVEVQVARVLEGQSDIRKGVEQVADRFRASFESTAASMEAVRSDLLTVASHFGQMCEERLRPPFEKVFASLKDVTETAAGQLASLASVDTRLTEFGKAVADLGEDFRQGKKSWWRG